jgi:hypothetical protein
MDTLRTMARDHGYSEKDIKEAEACLPATKKSQARVPSKPQTLHPEGNLTVGKRPASAPALRTEAPAPVVEEAPVTAPVVVPTEPLQLPVPSTPWWSEVLKYLGFIVVTGLAMSILGRHARTIYNNYKGPAS